MYNTTLNVIGWFKMKLGMWLVDLNYNFQCDWPIELFDNKLLLQTVWQHFGKGIGGK